MCHRLQQPFSGSGRGTRLLVDHRYGQSLRPRDELVSMGAAFRPRTRVREQTVNGENRPKVA